ncbi:MAG: OmpA family protein [Acidisphaera sp.]|nr:OmpA family protein [Acidisphaera sp.]
MKLRNLLLAATVLAVPVAVKAQPVTGLYVAGGAGYDYLTNTSIKSVSTVTANGTVISTTPSSSHLTGNGGYVGLGSIGWGFGNGLRVEIEGNYRNEHEHLNNQRFNGVSGGGTVETYGGMVNAIYDFAIGGFPVVPYVGVGVGGEATSLTNFYIYPTGASGHLQFRSGNNVGLAVQGILGVAYQIPAVPGLALTAEVRGLGILENEKFSAPASPYVSNTRLTAKLDDQVHISGLLGVRYAFNAPVPPPPPAPAPAPVVQAARSYLVFFDWDRADLTARARQVIAEAAQNSTRVQYTRIEVNGYTDTSGTPAYNQRLSVRRAENVAAELVRDGVPRNVMDIHGYGETHLLVQTGPGVREPQNRRVEIIYR